MQDVPKDLGRRIMEAAGLAVALHMQQSLFSQSNPDGVGNRFGGTGLDGGAAMDGGASTAPLPARCQLAGTLAGAKTPAAESGAS
jgi:hypothetical protein